MAEKVTIIPENKYIAVCGGEVIMLGDNPKELAQKIIKQRINAPVLIKFNGPNHSTKFVQELPPDISEDTIANLKDLKSM